MDDLSLALSDVCAAWPALQPPNRMRVSEGAAQNLRIARPGGASGYWNPAETPYMVEPVDMLGSRRHAAVCFVGPAQSGKTVALGEGWLAHAVVNDPGDMLIVQMTQDKAREYSKQRIDRAIRNSPTLWAMRGASSRDDNLHDKQFRNGMWAKIAWPTPSNLSSTSYRYVFLTDYDRVEDDIGGEGDMFSLGLARTRTFLSRGMLAVESSPGRPVVDPAWKATTPHEAPPTKGILGVYNRSDRRRLYWCCPHCSEWMQAEPGLGLFRLPPDDELIEEVRGLDIDRFVRERARVICSASGCIIDFEHRERMNRTARWLQDGLTIDGQGRVSGTPRESSIAGYWLGGAAAAYITWETLLRKHMQALLEYALNGSELALQTTVNTDQSMPYTSRHLSDAAATSADPASRAQADRERYIVPDEARYLVAAVDVQGGKNARFEVQVHAVGEHQQEWLVDRFPIKASKREGLGDEFAPIDPASHPEDWDLLTEKVVNATYRTHDATREMRVRLVVVDTGGEDGVTDKSYAWYRRLRREGLHARVRLVKGASQKDLDWYVRETMVGAKQGQGDVPLYLLNPNKLKDVVAACLRRRVPGPGYYNFPEPKSVKNPQGWLPASFFDELAAEVRNERGVWEQVRLRNEALDLCCYIKAGSMMLGVDRKGFWESPPRWARTHDDNSEVLSPEQRREMREPGERSDSRRTRQSAYLS
jgi:phage terminase large subunit GpA-like protein